jgi:hypothetical protein
MTMQTRSKRYGEWGPWMDRSEITLEFTHDKASVEMTAVREKPPFVPGWYRHIYSPGHMEMRYCEHRTPAHHPGGWELMTEDNLPGVFGFYDGSDDDFGL